MTSNGDSKKPGEFAAAQAANLADLVQVSTDAIVSRTLRKTPAGTLTVFAFDAGQELSEHSTPFDAYVYVLEGRVELTIAGASVPAVAGEIVLMPANVPHAVRASEPFKMLLTMIRDP